MARFFVGNFDFEHSLAGAGHQPSTRLKRFCLELATSWLAVADDGDYLWCPRPIPKLFFSLAAARALPRVIPVTDHRHVPQGAALTPWGWTDSLRRLGRASGWSCAAPSDAAVRAANSRSFSFQLESEWNAALPEAAIVDREDQLDAAVRRAACLSPRIVIKANWGMSGRERVVFNAPPDDAVRSWVRRRLSSQGAVFVEPWVERLEEIGIQFDVPPSGAPRLLGIAPLVCDAAGQYRGSWFTDPPGDAADFQRRWQYAVEMADQAARRVQAIGYFGPLGIDAMRYRGPEGAVWFRPLQDINARWTMGRLSLGWRRWLQKDEHGFWWHGPRAEAPAFPNAVLSLDRMIRTSPQQIEGTPVHHSSAVLFGRARHDA